MVKSIHELFVGMQKDSRGGDTEVQEGLLLVHLLLKVMGIIRRKEEMDGRRLKWVFLPRKGKKKSWKRGLIVEGIEIRPVEGS